MASAPQTITPFFLDQSRFQNLDDFIREQDEIQAQLQAELTAQSKAPSVCASPAHKKTKILPDIDALKAERDALEETGDINWVGRLLEYHQGNKLSQPSYTDHNVGHQKFSSSLKIAENPEPFTTTVMFSRKKDAKQYIAKLAVDWLVAQNSMPSDGSVKFPKSPQTSLGTSIYHGWADFGVDARIDGKVGEFRDVYGKKNAKEVCARMVLSFLRDIERLRLEGVEEMEMKRKRIGGGSEGSSSSESF
ncbi:hypothetical protein ACMFMG_010101 [Clarireedia jacksonii]